MSTEEITYFNLLKAAVVEVFTQNNAVQSVNCNDWTGQEIELFKEDFILKVKSSFSEKWFYTYFKNDVKKLPRIDMLNLLSAYAGYENFADFKEKNKQNVVKTNTPRRQTNHKYWFFAVIGALILLTVFYFSFGFNKAVENTFSFCFVEKSNHLPPKTPLRITLLLEKESPMEMTTDNMACFHYTTKAKQIKFVVQSPFHEPDTIIRSINHLKEETISLRSNDYALMLQYYTSSNVKDWKRKRERLEHIIADHSTIYRVYPNNGIAIYTKKEFINQLTIPTEDLKNIEILEIDYKDHQIIKLKFIVKE